MGQQAELLNRDRQLMIARIETLENVLERVIEGLIIATATVRD